MKLDISSIASNSGGKLSFQGKTLFEPVSFCGNNFEFIGETEINGEIANRAGEFFLNAQVSGKFETACARCGKPAEQDFSFELNEKLIKEGSNSTDEDAVVFQGDVIDVSDLAVNIFLMEAPGRFLCKEDCKGLCPVCGQDLNEKQCGCETEAVDPRFDVLNDIKF